MSSVLERLRAELDELGESVQRGLEQGRLQLERTRLRSVRDGHAKELGLLAYQHARGEAIDTTRHDTLLDKLDRVMDDLARIDRELAAVRGETVSVGEDPPPPAEPAEAEVETEAVPER